MLVYHNVAAPYLVPLIKPNLLFKKKEILFLSVVEEKTFGNFWAPSSSDKSYQCVTELSVLSSKPQITSKSAAVVEGKYIKQESEAFSALFYLININLKLWCEE